MKITVFTVLLTISTTWGIKAKIDDPKDKREAPTGSYLPASGLNYQSPSTLGQEENAISIGAGYSVGGGAKPTYSFAGQTAGVGASYQLQPENGHANLQLAPSTLQSSSGPLVSNDLSQLMSQISHGLNSGAISLPSGSQGSLYQFAGQSPQLGQEISLPQFTYGSPKLQQYSLGDQGQGSLPAYALGTKGLGTFSSTGPVLFNPDSAVNQAALSYAGPNFGQTYQAAALPLGDSGHSLGGYSFAGSGQPLGGSLKGISGNYATPVGKSSFKPSAFLGSSVQSDSGAGLAGFSGSYAAPSFAAYQSGSLGGPSFSSVGHGAGLSSLSGFSGSPSKAVAASYLPAKFEGVGSLESISNAFSASGQIAPPGTTYGKPAFSNNVHAASAPSPAYYVSGKHSSPTFGLGSSSYRSPALGHSSVNSFSSGPKYSFGGHGTGRYSTAKDVQGSYSEPNYNTIKYSEELKPHYN